MSPETSESQDEGAALRLLVAAQQPWDSLGSGDSVEVERAMVWTSEDGLTWSQHQPHE